MTQPALINRIASELKAAPRAEVIECECGQEHEDGNAVLVSLVLDQHLDQEHAGSARFCEWAACRYAAGERSGFES